MGAEQFLVGKKTYLIAGLLVALGVWMVLRGQVANGMSVVLFGLGFVGLGDRANRHQSEILQAIDDMGSAIHDTVAHSPLAAADICRVVSDVSRAAAIAHASQAQSQQPPTNIVDLARAVSDLKDAEPAKASASLSTVVTPEAK
jgi:hypothetical protein